MTPFRFGFRPRYMITTNAQDGFELNTDTSITDIVTGGESHTEILPSLNLVADMSDEFLLRGGVFRGLSRADSSAMTFSRTFSGNSPEDGEIITDVNDLLNVTANGNPNLKPFTSWNVAFGGEWYPNDDSILAIALSYKNFTGGFENARTIEDYVIDDNLVTLPLIITYTNKEKSDLYGVEVTAATRFLELQAILSGTGMKVSYNYACLTLAPVSQI